MSAVEVLRLTACLLILLVAFGPPGSAQAHNPGQDCLGCHAEFQVGGTAYTNNTGATPMPGVAISLTAPDGDVLDLEVSSGAGNFVSSDVAAGRYLMQVGLVMSRTWHVMPAQGSCNTCHTPGGNASGERSVTMPPGHTRIPADNDCAHCHHFPQTRSLEQLAAPGVLNGSAPALPAPATTVEINGGRYEFDPADQAIETVRPDVFAPGYYSLFDVILAVAGRNGIEIDYEYDEAAKTHWITKVNGVAGDYWYRWQFHTGNQAVRGEGELSRKRDNRWDELLWRPGAMIRLSDDDEDVEDLKAAYRAEIEREGEFGHVVGDVRISANPSDLEGNPPEAERISVRREYEDLRITAHNTRTGEFASPYLKPFQPGVATVMDIPLSLLDQGELGRVETVFFDRINGSFIDAYYMQAMGFPGEGVIHASGSQGLVADTHLRTTRGTGGQNANAASNVVHIPLGLQVIHAPDYSSWRWIELGSADYADDMPGAMAIAEAGVANAASYETGSVAPGEIIVIYGTRLGPAGLTTLRLSPDGQRVTAELAQTRVSFDGVVAPVIYTSDRQVSVVVPYSVAGRQSTRVQVRHGRGRSNTLALPVVASKPGIFTLDASGAGQGAILNEDRSVNGPDNAAVKGSVVMIYLTGTGQTDPPSQTGRVVTGEPPEVALPVSVRIGGVEAEVIYAGAAPEAVSGLTQINVRIPVDLAASGAVAVDITVGEASSQAGVTISVAESE